MLPPDDLQLNLDVRLTSELSKADLDEIGELRLRVYGPPEQRLALPAFRLTWAGVEDTVCLVRGRCTGVLVCSVFVGQRTVLINDVPTPAGTIRGVMTHPDFRRFGFARGAMHAAHQYLWQDLSAELGILLSSEMAVPFYLSLGWQIFEGTVLCAQPDGPISYTQTVPEEPLMLLLPPGAPKPSGKIDLGGLPF